MRMLLLLLFIVPGCGSDRTTTASKAPGPTDGMVESERVADPTPATKPEPTAGTTPETQPAPSAPQAVNLLTWSNGTSTYRLTEDHEFSLGPVAMSGRSIEGWWMFVDDTKSSVAVVGIWSWLNGGSAPNDYRRFVIQLDSKAAADPEKAVKISKEDFEKAVQESKSAAPAVPKRS